MTAWQLNPATLDWRVSPKNNYVKNFSFEADRRLIPEPVKPRQDVLTGWTTTYLQGSPVGNDYDNGIKLNKNNSEADQQHVVGKMSLLITDQVPFKREVSQTIKPEPYIPFPNGNYRLSFKLKNQGKLSNVKVLVKTGGKTITHNCPTQEIDWHTETFNVKVSGNQATIIFHVEGEAQGECRIDDVEMIAI